MNGTGIFWHGNGVEWEDVCIVMRRFLDSIVAPIPVPSHSCAKLPRVEKTKPWQIAETLQATRSAPAQAQQENRVAERRTIPAFTLVVPRFTAAVIRRSTVTTRGH